MPAHPEIALCDPLQRLLRNADAIIADRNQPHLLSHHIPLQAHSYLAVATCGEFHRVAKDIHQHLAQAHHIAPQCFILHALSFDMLREIFGLGLGGMNGGFLLKLIGEE